MPARYCARETFKAAVGLSASDTAEDARIDAVLASVSRQIDGWTKRVFHPVQGTRYFTATMPGTLLLREDLLAVTTLRTDDDGDRSYATTWQATDYDLAPYNASQQSPPEPYTVVAVAPSSTRAFPSVARGVRISGIWGYYDVRRVIDALDAEVDDTETELELEEGTACGVGQTLRIDDEQLEIRAIDSEDGTITVLRGVNGTMAASHDEGAEVAVYEYPVIDEAALIQASRIFRRKDTPFGVAGSPEFGALRLLARLDPDVQQMLTMFRRLVAG